MTNFYFEIEDPDDDILDGDGTVLEKGQRKMGVCKEERKQPIVQMESSPLRVGSPTRQNNSAFTTFETN